MHTHSFRVFFITACFFLIHEPKYRKEEDYFIYGAMYTKLLSEYSLSYAHNVDCKITLKYFSIQLTF